MSKATFIIATPRLLDQVVLLIDKINMDDRDTKGDLYEYMLSKIASAGTNGQFRTPRHIIRMMVDMVQPKKDDIICDPSSVLAFIASITMLGFLNADIVYGIIIYFLLKTEAQ